MKPVLICPVARSEVEFLCQEQPLSNIALLGRGLVEYWLSHIACEGARSALILAADRADQVRALVGDGSRWGIRAEIAAATHEDSPEQAAAKFRKKHHDHHHSEIQTVLMDHFPGMPGHPIFASYSQWFAGLLAWIPNAQTPDRVGMREVSPGVWAGMHTRVSRKAKLRPPCWLGDHVYLGPGAVAGPGAILEAGAFIERDAEIEASYVGPDTYVGRYVQIKGSVAWGNALIDWSTGLRTTIQDAFLLGPLRRREARRQSQPLLERVAGVLLPAGPEKPQPATPGTCLELVKIEERFRRPDHQMK